MWRCKICYEVENKSENIHTHTYMKVCVSVRAQIATIYVAFMLICCEKFCAILSAPTISFDMHRQAYLPIYLSAYILYDIAEFVEYARSRA